MVPLKHGNNRPRWMTVAGHLWFVCIEWIADELLFLPGNGPAFWNRFLRPEVCNVRT